MALQKLIADTSVKYNPATGQVWFENGITIRSNSRYAPVTKVTMGISPTTRLPVARATIKTPPVRGRLNHFVYLTDQFGIEIEITTLPRGQQYRTIPPVSYVPAPLSVPPLSPVPRRPPSSTPTWDVLVGTALIGGAIALVVVTVVEDIVFPPGIANDPASAAAAAAMIARGWSLLRNAAIVQQGAAAAGALASRVMAITVRGGSPAGAVAGAP